MFKYMYILCFECSAGIVERTTNKQSHGILHISGCMFEFNDFKTASIIINLQGVRIIQNSY